jgi:DNA-binding MarR family transcriptional regulator
MGRSTPQFKIVSSNVDAETRAHDDHHVSLRLWLRMLACTNQIENGVRQFLQAEFATTLPRFDFMAQLERAPGGLRMSELSQRLMVTGGNVTGIADGLEKEGLILRETDAADRRASRVKLTTEGRRQFTRMAREHERWIIELFSGISAKEKAQLLGLLGELKRQISAQPEE